MMARLVKHCPVLIVEDDEDLREMMAQLLTLEGFQTATVANGREALEYLHEASTPDVILLDLMMPVMNGWQFRSAQTNDPELSKIPVVVVTAAGARDQIPAIDADAWLSKPVDFDRLLATIDPLCSRSPGAGL
jgi:CheY-like chemotaxis protein